MSVSTRLIQGRYEVLEPIGRGGHGTVYRALDRTLNANVAIKFLHDAVAADPQYNIRFVREAQAMAALAGTAAIEVHSWGTTDDGAMYLVMELLTGQDLDDYLRAREASAGRLPLAELVEMMGPIVDTLEAAHGLGIIHRDLKPANIFIRDQPSGGGVRLLDFGLAKMVNASPLTREGMVAGSPSYIAPEAWKGNPRVLDHRIDVYALGAILFRALGGTVPFGGANLFEKIELATRGQRPSLHALRPDLPPEIDGWVDMALAIDPEARFQRVRGLWNALRGLLT